MFEELPPPSFSTSDFTLFSFKHLPTPNWKLPTTQKLLRNLKVFFWSSILIKVIGGRWWWEGGFILPTTREHLMWIHCTLCVEEFVVHCVLRTLLHYLSILWPFIWVVLPSVQPAEWRRSEEPISRWWGFLLCAQREIIPSVKQSNTKIKFKVLENVGKFGL